MQILWRKLKTSWNCNTVRNKVKPDPQKSGEEIRGMAMGRLKVSQLI